MKLNIFLMLVLSIVGIGVSRYLRGNTSYADIFFPALCLGLGQSENFIHCWQIQFVGSTVCAGLCIACAAMKKPNLAVVPALTLPLWGMNGLIYAPFAAMWLARKRPLVCALLVLEVALYFANYKDNGSWGRRPRILEAWSALLLFLSNGWGCVNNWQLGGLIVIGMVVSAMVLSYRRVNYGLVIMLLGFLALAGAISYGRACMGLSQLCLSRYVTLAGTGLFGAYLAGVAAKCPIGVCLQFLLVAFVITIYPTGSIQGKNIACQFQGGMQPVMADLNRGILLPVFVGRHYGPLTGGQSRMFSKHQMYECLTALSERKVQPYCNLRILVSMNGGSMEVIMKKALDGGNGNFFVAVDGCKIYLSTKWYNEVGCINLTVIDANMIRDALTNAIEVASMKDGE
jgi:hypothetical protein